MLAYQEIKSIVPLIHTHKYVNFSHIAFLVLIMDIQAVPRLRTSDLRTSPASNGLP